MMLASTLDPKPMARLLAIYALCTFAFSSASPISSRSDGVSISTGSHSNAQVIAPKTYATTLSNVITNTDVAPKVDLAPTIPIPYSVPYSVPVPVASGYPYPVPTATSHSCFGVRCNDCDDCDFECADCDDCDDCDDCEFDAGFKHPHCHPDCDFCDLDGCDSCDGCDDWKECDEHDDDDDDDGDDCGWGR